MAYDLAHNLNGIFRDGDSYGVPAHPSAFVRKRARGFDEGQIDEAALKRKALMEIQKSGGMKMEPGTVGNLPPGEVSNLGDQTVATGESRPQMPVAGNGNIVPESNDKKRLLRLIAQRKK